MEDIVIHLLALHSTAPISQISARRRKKTMWPSAPWRFSGVEARAVAAVLAAVSRWCAVWVIKSATSSCTLSFAAVLSKGHSVICDSYHAVTALSLHHGSIISCMRRCKAYVGTSVCHINSNHNTPVRWLIKNFQLIWDVPEKKQTTSYACYLRCRICRGSFVTVMK